MHPPRHRLPAYMMVLVVAIFATRALADDNRARAPVEVNEWSIWVGNPTLKTLNAAKVYRNPMPNAVGTSRPKLEERENAEKFPIAPVSIIQFFGEPARDVDVDLRVKKGSILAHWPMGREQPNRVTWFGSTLTVDPPTDAPMGHLPDSSWLRQIRESSQALYLKYQTRSDRLIAYDVELASPVPLRLRGGPDEYTLQNLTNHRLIDVAVIAPTDDGFRVGWLDELPSAAIATEKPDDGDSKKPDDPKDGDSQKRAEALFQEPDEKPAADKEEPLPPLPAEADTTVRARVDQLLNQPIALGAKPTPRRDLIGAVAQQARIRVEFDAPALAREKIDLSQPTEPSAAEVGARDALIDLLGPIGLSYRVTADGRLFVTTSTRLAEAADETDKAIEGPPVKLVMSQPRAADDASYGELTRDALARRLESRGLRKDVAARILDHYGADLFEPGELIVLASFSREAIDEAILLDVFPPPKKLTRVALVIVHGVDPRLQDRARELVKQLGDPAWKTREWAESSLLALGSVAVPALEDALRDPDVEVIARAERLLLKLGRPAP